MPESASRGGGVSALEGGLLLGGVSALWGCLLRGCLQIRGCLLLGGVCFEGACLFLGGLLGRGCLLLGGLGMSAFGGYLLLGGLLLGGVCLGGCLLGRGVCSWGVASQHALRQTTPCEQNDRQVQKYYLGHNFVAAGNNRVSPHTQGLATAPSPTPVCEILDPPLHQVVTILLR